MEKQRGSKNASGLVPTLEFETAALNRGFRNIAGVDEAGRGPLAGPVVVAAVILGEAWNTGHPLDDSKRLSAQKRECLFDLVCSEAQAFKIVSISPQEIDRLNILQATLFGMYRCLTEIEPAADYALVDGNHYPHTKVPGETVIKGDARSKSIAAASILAKVTRDRIMLENAARYPEWGFESHKGYPTKMHREAIAKYGLTPLHRKSFRLKPVQMSLL
ncbi:MAG: ribonuclease HII [SAR324 cluster bacterium]|nr:ribonuclease HII [SAR324 cluster bacterium]